MWQGNACKIEFSALLFPSADVVERIASSTGSIDVMKENEVVEIVNRLKEREKNTGNVALDAERKALESLVI